jgi:CRP-like cAMP-binding protein
LSLTTCFLGEYQIILEHRHEYSARAVCNTDIYVLLKSDIELAFEAYPDDRTLVYAATEDKYRQAQQAKKSRQAKENAFSDLEEEFGIGSAPVTTPLYAEPPNQNAKGRKMSIISSGFLLRDKSSMSSLTDIKSIGSKGSRQLHEGSMTIRQRIGKSLISLDSRPGTASRRGSLQPTSLAVPETQIIISQPSNSSDLDADVPQNDGSLGGTPPNEI